MAVSMAMPILIVDEYNTMVRILRNLLRQLGFTNIDEASNGAAALAKLRAKQYHLVIADAELKCAADVRAEERYRDTPFLTFATAQPGSIALPDTLNAHSLKQKIIAELGPF